jgi:hypothetical protein
MLKISSRLRLACAAIVFVLSAVPAYSIECQHAELSVMAPKFASAVHVRRVAVRGSSEWSAVSLEIENREQRSIVLVAFLIRFSFDNGTSIAVPIVASTEGEYIRGRDSLPTEILDRWEHSLPPFLEAAIQPGTRFHATSQVPYALVACPTQAEIIGGTIRFVTGIELSEWGASRRTEPVLLSVGNTEGLAQCAVPGDAIVVELAVDACGDVRLATGNGVDSVRHRCLSSALRGSAALPATLGGNPVSDALTAIVAIGERRPQNIPSLPHVHFVPIGLVRGSASHWEALIAGSPQDSPYRKNKYLGRCATPSVQPGGWPR